MNTIDLTKIDLKIGYDHITIESPSFTEALNLVRSSTQQLAEWAKTFGVNAAIVNYPKCDRPFRIPASFSQKTIKKGLNNMSELLGISSNLQVAEMKISRPILEVMLEFLESPEMSAGLVRLSDERQVCVTDAAARLIPNNEAEELVRLKREDYWWLPDLEEFNREWRSRLEPNNPQSFLEYSYRSEVDNLGNWGRLTTRYRLIKDDRNVLYHVCYSVGYDAIAKMK